MNRGGYIPEIKARLGARIRQRRKAQGLTQEKLGMMVGIDRSYIVSIERGGRNITLETMVRISEGLGTTLSELLDHIEEPSEQ